MAHNNHVLNSLEPVTFICTVQALLTNYSSDAVRLHLPDQNVDVADAPWYSLAKDSSDFTSKDLLESPFFTMVGLKEFETNARPPTGRLSSNVSSTGRSVLDNFYSYNVTFEEWKNFDALLNAQDISPSDILPEDISNWGVVLRTFIERTFDSRVTGPGEMKELECLFSCLGDAGFRF